MHKIHLVMWLVVIAMALTGCGQAEHAELMREVERVNHTDQSSPANTAARAIVESERAR